MYNPVKPSYLVLLQPLLLLFSAIFELHRFDQILLPLKRTVALLPRNPLLRFSPNALRLDRKDGGGKPGSGRGGDGDAGDGGARTPMAKAAVEVAVLETTFTQERARRRTSRFSWIRSCSSLFSRALAFSFSSMLCETRRRRRERGSRSSQVTGTF